MKKLACALIALLPLSAFAYPIDVERQLNGAEVSVSTQEVDHNIGAVVLYNYGQSQAQCSAVFRNGPEAPRTRQVEVSADVCGQLARGNNAVFGVMIESHLVA